MAQALVLGNVLLPFLTIPLTWIFIPNQPLNADFLDEHLEREAGIELRGVEAAPEVADASLPRGSLDTSLLRAASAEFQTNGRTGLM